MTEALRGYVESRWGKRSLPFLLRGLVVVHTLAPKPLFVHCASCETPTSPDGSRPIGEDGRWGKRDDMRQACWSGRRKRMERLRKIADDLAAAHPAAKAQAMWIDFEDA